MALYTPYSSKGSATPSQAPTTEFEILKDTHQFLRTEGDIDENRLPWDERLAKQYYSSLYREYAICDLKHYKSGNFALRWRTEEEVLSGAGETTCGNSRCPLHQEFSDAVDDVRPALTMLELPFSYTEHGESKFALVKVVLCAKCCKKLMWKRNKEKELEEQKRREGEQPGVGIKHSDVGDGRKRRRSHSQERGGHEPMPSSSNQKIRDSDLKRRRSSRSRSPRSRADGRRRCSP